MSYAIANIIYGIPFTDEIQNRIEPEGVLNEEIDGPEDLGFQMLYSGSSGVRPGFCGVMLYRFDECSEPFSISQLILKPTAEQKAEAEAKIAELPKDVREVCLPLDTYIVWSSS